MKPIKPEYRSPLYKESSKRRTTFSISKWTIFSTDRDYTEDDLFLKFREMGLVSASLNDLPEFIVSGWDWQKYVWALDSEFLKDGDIYIRGGVVQPMVWHKIFCISKKPAIYKKGHWHFLLKSKAAQSTNASPTDSSSVLQLPQ